MNLNLCWDGHPVTLKFKGSGGLSVTAFIECDPEAHPFWLGRFLNRHKPGTIHAGLSEWFEPAIPIQELEAGLLPLHGKRKARLLAHERVRDDCRRLRRFGRDWWLYRITITVFRDGHEIASDTIGGLNEHGLPFHDIALIEALTADLLSRMSGVEAAA